MGRHEGDGRAGDRIVGILGGMGPAATIDLMQRVIAATPADDDVDHLRMLVDNNPKVPSRIEALIDGTGPSPAPALIDMAITLAERGADFLAIACNTAHHYHSEVAVAVEVPVLNIVELSAAHIAHRHDAVHRVGLLASSALRLVGLYEPAFAAHGIEVLHPSAERQRGVMELIRAVKAGCPTGELLTACNDAADSLVDRGAQCILIACTELSTVADRLSIAVPVHDAADVLADAIVETALAPDR